MGILKVKGYKYIDRYSMHVSGFTVYVPWFAAMLFDVLGFCVHGLRSWLFCIYLPHPALGSLCPKHPNNMGKMIISKVFQTVQDRKYSSIFLCLTLQQKSWKFSKKSMDWFTEYNSCGYIWHIDLKINSSPYTEVMFFVPGQPAQFHKKT